MKLLAALLSLVGCSPAADPKPNLIHVPKNGRCPKESRLLKDVFTQKEGTKESGCFFGAPDGDLFIDYLRPGESVAITLISDFIKTQPKNKI